MITVNAAVSNFDGIGKLLFPQVKGVSLTSQGRLVSTKGEGVPIPVVKLDIFLPRLRVQPDVIKIDVEGAELNVIKGGLHTLDKGVRLVIVELHNVSAKASIIRLLEDLGYAEFERDNFLFFTFKDDCYLKTENRT